LITKKEDAIGVLFPALLDELELGFGFFEQLFLVGETLAGFFDEFFWSFSDVVWALETLLEGRDFLTHLKDTIFKVGLVLVVDVLWNLDVDVVIVNSQMEASGVFGVNLWYARRLGEMLDEKLVIVH
jgi:hypothetical protein